MSQGQRIGTRKVYAPADLFQYLATAAAIALAIAFQFDADAKENLGLRLAELLLFVGGTMCLLGCLYASAVMFRDADSEAAGLLLLMMFALLFIAGALLVVFFYYNF